MYLSENVNIIACACETANMLPESACEKFSFFSQHYYKDILIKVVLTF